MARDPERKKKRRDEEDNEREEKITKPVDIEAELAELESAWSEAKDKGDSFADLPDNTYQAKVTGAKINKSQSSGRLQVSWEFTMASGDYKNRKKFAHDGLETKENMDYVKTRLARLGVDVTSLKLVDLPEALEETIGVFCEIKIKTRGDFQNAYVQKVIDLDDAESETATADEDDWKPSKRSKPDPDKDDADDDKPAKTRSDRDEDDEPPKKKSRDEDEGEGDDVDANDKPAKSKRRDPDEDEDDEPKKKKSRDADEDEEDEDKPKKKSRDADEDEEDDEPVKKKKSKF